MAEILNNPSELRKEEKPVNLKEANIIFNNVSFRYSLEGNMILNNVTFAIREGQTVAFVGRSGSGKITITKLIQMYLAESGDILINHNKINDMNANSLRNNIGVVLQRISFLTEQLEII